jgi:thiol-disulfide isomerase/thioredoxin
MGRGTHNFPIASRNLLFVTCLAFCSLTLRASPHTQQAAALDLSGSPVNPLSASPGKVVVLIFVRTDCPISNRYAPTIQQLSTQHEGKVAFWLVYPARKESAEVIRKHERDFGYQLPALRDLQHALVKQSLVQITPEAAVFDAGHRLVYHGRIDNLYEDFGRARTMATTHELGDAIQAALSGKTLAADSVPAIGCYISDLE